MSSWTAAMRRGDFALAWQIGDAILSGRRAGETCWHLPRHLQWVWDGRPLIGQRVLVRCYHGLGDTIQFARFLPILAHMCRAVSVWAQPALLPLLERLRMPPKSSNALHLLPLHDGAPEVVYDVDVEIMELPHALRTTLEGLPASVPYFSVPAEARPCATRCVGLVARAGEWDPRRSVPPQLMSWLTDIPGVQPFNLQLGTPLPGAQDISSPDVLALAGRIQAMDLVVTADTMTAHLAGALAVPTWTLLTADADWRWMDDRLDSPWYPTMRLFRQPVPGDWQSVIAHVRADLAG